MLIECPFCHSRSRLSDDKEGAKVRCGECGKVYRARDSRAVGHKAAPKKAQSGPIIAVCAVAVIGIVALIAMKSRGGDPPPVQAAPPAVEEEPEPEVAVDPTGWDSELVQRAVRLHELAAKSQSAALEERLFGPLLAQRDELDPKAVDLDAAEAAWSDADRSTIVAAALDSLRAVDETGHVAGWVPYDGRVVTEGEDVAVVRLSATPIDGGTTKREIEWRFARTKSGWKAWYWSEWLTDTERRQRERGYDVVELSDGAVVVEREPEPLGHLEDTPDDVRERLDELLVTMFDLEQTRGQMQAAREVTEIGRPAIPLLLTHLYENELYTLEDSKRANIAVSALREITGEYFGYQPQSLAQGALGTSEERRQSSVRQWFAWWHRNEDTFTGPERPEPDEE